LILCQPLLVCPNSELVRPARHVSKDATYGLSKGLTWQHYRDLSETLGFTLKFVIRSMAQRSAGARPPHGMPKPNSMARR